MNFTHRKCQVIERGSDLFRRLYVRYDIDVRGLYVPVSVEIGREFIKCMFRLILFRILCPHSFRDVRYIYYVN